jgi:hypothetical protein
MIDRKESRVRCRARRLGYAVRKSRRQISLRNFGDTCCLTRRETWSSSARVLTRRWMRSSIFSETRRRPGRHTTCRAFFLPSGAGVPHPRPSRMTAIPWALRSRARWIFLAGITFALFRHLRACERPASLEVRWCHFSGLGCGHACDYAAYWLGPVLLSPFRLLPDK